VAPLIVFLDANILFSASLGGPAFELLWQLERAGQVRLVTSRHCRIEAEENLKRKRPDALDRFRRILDQVGEAADPLPDQIERASRPLPEKDAPVFASAVAAGSDVLLTGDLRHFGRLMGRRDLSPRVRTVRAFLLEGP